MLLLTPGASNSSLKIVVWILIGCKSRPYLGVVVTETVLKPAATSPPLDVWANWWELGIVLKLLLFLPLSAISQGQVVGERGTREARESRVDRSSLEKRNSLGEEGWGSLEGGLGHADLSFLGLHLATLRVVPNARGPGPSAALPSLPGRWAARERADKFPRRESERPQG